VKRIALDIETTMDHQTIHLCITQDVDTNEVRIWKTPDGLWDYLKQADLIVAHNGIGFDFPILNKLWKTKIGLKQAYDTLVVSRLLEPTRDGGHSLDAWGKTLGVAKLDYKATWQWMMNRREEYDGECFDRPIEGLLEFYCCRDVAVLSILFHRLCSSLESSSFSMDSVVLEHSVAAIINKQEKNGFKLDTIHATCLLAELKGKMSAINDRMQETWPPYEQERFSEKTGKQLKSEIVIFNPASRQQVAEKLIGLGWKPTKKTDKGSVIVDESTLQGLKWPEAQMIAEYFMLQKRIAQIESWFSFLGEDGRVHGRVITNGAITGRATHSSPNMGQIPNSSSPYGKECRQCWTVEEGMVQVGIDLSGIELRCFAHYLNDDDYTKEVVYGDVHTRNQQAFGVDSRNDAKTVLYATLYGASPAKIGTIIGGNAKRGQTIISNFERSVPAYAKLKNKVATYAAKGWLPGLDGRKLWVRSEHSALNTLLQSAGAIIAKQWIVCANRKLTESKIPFKFIAWVHDEIQIETEPKYAEQVGLLVVESAKEAGEILKFRCPVGAEWKQGKNWYDCH
jgi:DNA polymerase I-like protein with 3'-5' exonuclease and polymerase domains